MRETRKNRFEHYDTEDEEQEERERQQSLERFKEKLDAVRNKDARLLMMVRRGEGESTPLKRSRSVFSPPTRSSRSSGLLQTRSTWTS